MNLPPPFLRGIGSTSTGWTLKPITWPSTPTAEVERPNSSEDSDDSGCPLDIIECLVGCRAQNESVTEFGHRKDHRCVGLQYISKRAGQAYPQA
ncbi:hypothetical protein LENED_010404 [Lentinula edodes]|uniref:Uncharacterized protein n=1 Tax=Lentinula edodes TaxID=5353 RepID=A0A1Q3EMB2_LENED|nr:hypothetical protein LENED_010404 [Lentinula edodes]